MGGEVRGLVVQGGGMRGIYSAGAMAALAQAGLAGSFQHIFASSSGAKKRRLPDVRANRSSRRRLRRSPQRRVAFIRYWRLSKIVDIDYLIDNILRHSTSPLDVKAVVDSPTVLHVILTEFSSARSHEISSKDVAARDSSGNLLYEIFRATSALPVFYNRVVEISGENFVDGGISDAIPLMRAIEAGCTDIIVVTTRSPHFRRERMAGIRRAVGQLLLARHPQSLRRRLLDEDKLYNKTMNLLQDPDKLGRDIHITLVSPSDPSRLVGRTTRDRSKLWDCAQMAREDVINVLGVSVP